MDNEIEYMTHRLPPSFDVYLRQNTGGNRKNRVQFRKIGTLWKSSKGDSLEGLFYLVAGSSSVVVVTPSGVEPEPDGLP